MHILHRNIQYIELLIFNSNTWNHLTVCKKIIDIELNLLMIVRNTWNHLTECKQMSSKICFDYTWFICFSWK